VKRLLILTADFLPTMGGISIAIHHLANAFCAEGVETKVLAPITKGDHSFQQSYAVIPDNTSPDKWGMLSYRREDDRIVEVIQDTLSRFPADALMLGHCHGYGAAAITSGLRNEIPVGLFIHGNELRRQIICRSPISQRFVCFCLNVPTFRSRILSITRNVDVVFCNSAYTAGLAEATGRTKRVVVTGCGLCEQDWQRELDLTPAFALHSKSRFRHQLGLGDGPVIGSVGRIISRKRVDRILDVLVRIPKAKAVIIGDGLYANELKAYAEKIGVASRVTWFGTVDESTKWAFLRAMDVFFLLSQELPSGDVEGFGIVLLEAAAAGTPVITAASGGMVDVVQDGVTGLLCNPDDLDSVVQATQRFLTDQNLAASCVANLRQRIRDKFNWKHIAQKILAEFDQSAKSLRKASQT